MDGDGAVSGFSSRQRNRRLVQTGGLIIRDVTGRAGTHVGEEYDLYSWYELNAHINVGAGVGHIMPGSFLAATTSGPTLNYSYFAINFKDNGKGRF